VRAREKNYGEKNVEPPLAARSGSTGSAPLEEGDLPTNS
jgi:hypothetical protein